MIAVVVKENISEYEIKMFSMKVKAASCLMYDYVQFKFHAVDDHMFEIHQNCVFSIWALPNAFFPLVLTQRSKGAGGLAPDGNTSTSTEERDPLLQDDVDWQKHT